MNSISPILNVMIKASDKASKVIIRDFGEIENLQVARKGPRDFVTKTDKKVEKILIEELSRAKKNYSFLTEETGIIENNDKNKIWIIDPIDGTTNFLHGIPHFAISIALKIENELKTALIFDPIKNEIFFAEKNSGAYFNNHRIRVSKKSDLEECLFSTDQLGLNTVFPSLNMRCTGCASLDMAYVGSGRLDGFFHDKIHLWDIAAGMLIVEEAGGTINDISKYDDESIDIRAASNNIYDKMMETLGNF
tara:strand:- start:39 stop:785 length:747 start_codon:yes stop_codon:yes gene_type:complete